MVSGSATRANRQLLAKLLMIAVAMFGFGFAMVPFYRAFCQAVGLYDLGRPDEKVDVSNTQVDATRSVKIEFDTNVRQGLNWEFRALERSVQVHPGELVHATFEIHNRSRKAITGQAIPSYGPNDAARYFRKLECFCFTQQTLAPGEVRRMPVVFVIDPALPRELQIVTLSYTFFEIEGAPARAG